MPRRLPAPVAGCVVLLACLGGSAPHPTPEEAEHGRSVRDLNSGWRFHRGEVDGGEEVGLDDSAWRQVDLPHDWTVEDLPPLPAGEPTVDICEGVWRFAKGDDPSWKAADLDDSAWREVTLPAAWEEHSGYREREAYGWFRRPLEVPRAFRGKPFFLVIGWAKDADQTFVNGTLVGQTGGFPPKFRGAASRDRRYRVDPDLLRGDGRDVVAVRVYRRRGYGGGIWRKQQPHTRSGPFDTKAENGAKTGYTVGGVGWYRKAFRVDGDDERRARVQFGGVYQDARVWINGVPLGNHPYGYTSFGYDLTPHLNRGGENILAVRAENVGYNTRWYSGSGIYRGVQLIETGPVAVRHWGSSVTTPEASADRATVRVRRRVRVQAGAADRVTAQTRVRDPTGAVVAAAEQTLPAAAAGGELAFDQSMPIEAPQLWSPDSPRLYTAVTRLLVAGRVVDRVRTRLGVRWFSFDAERGFELNGRPMLLRGSCMHHDNGPLGAAVFPDAERRRVRLTKEAGFNAIRCAHNPPSTAFLDACDDYGLLVIDEAFDIWRSGKPGTRFYSTRFDDAWRADLEAMILRDRNHPSIIMWSIGNEIPKNDTPAVAATARMLAQRCRELDPTRPVTAAVQGVNPKKDPYFAALDVAGYNYALKWNEGHRYRENAYVDDHRRHPGRVIYGAESFASKAFDYWMAAVDHPWVVGDFVWTGFDYLGESSIGWRGFGYPVYWPVAYCGDISITGRRRPQSYYRSALFGDPTVAVYVKGPAPLFDAPRGFDWGFEDLRESWTWPDRGSAEPLQVVVFSSFEEVELTLNGESLGRQPTTRRQRFRATFRVPYEPGELRAYGLRGGQRVAESALTTAGPPASIRLRPERRELVADGQSLAYVPLEVVDAAGVVCPDSSATVRVRVGGAATLAALGSDNPGSRESFQQPARRVWQGRGLLVLRSGRQAGPVTVTARSEGLSPAEMTIRVAPAEPDH